MPRPRFKRVLLKLSGEVLMGPGQFGIDPDTVARIAEEIAGVAQDHELCMVVGGGNIFRGLAGAAKGFDRASADYMGMLATVMNALAMQHALAKIGARPRARSQEHTSELQSTMRISYADYCLQIHKTRLTLQ